MAFPALVAGGEEAGLESEVELGGEDLQGIWLFTLNESDRIVMVINVLEDKLFGSAKSEGAKKWNAVVMGDLSPDWINLTLLYMMEGDPQGLTLSGRPIDPGRMEGRFSWADSYGGYSSGTFDGLLINPDRGSYLPAAVGASAGSEPASSAVEGQTTSDQVVAAETGDSKYTDVHDLAHLVPPAAGVIPPGMGMFGGGGGASMSG
ncbi:MAG: hypothetical protein JW986_05685 [Methanotrichaceae archaeon]|nr:hypothetical protein [Methanotrichaceae archaeon]